MDLQKNNFILYTDANGEVKVEVCLKDETLWLTQKAMAELFGVGVPAIAKHLANIYESGELEQETTISILETVQQEGKRTVSAYFDYIENQIEIRKEQNRPFTMQELADSINRFLNFNDFKVLEHKGTVSHQQAIAKAENEYNEFNKTQKIESDFDRFAKQVLKKKN